jgi:hypothetical protein
MSRFDAGLEPGPEQRREPHCRIDTATGANGCQRTTIAKMTGNQAQLFQIAIKDLSSPSRAILMADAVEAIPPDPLLQPFVGTGINGSCFWDLSVKGVSKTAT